MIPEEREMAIDELGVFPERPAWRAEGLLTVFSDYWRRVRGHWLDAVKATTTNKWFLLLMTLLAITFFLSGCMKIQIRAESGSTVTVSDSGNKRTTINTDASIPASALGL